MTTGAGPRPAGRPGQPAATAVGEPTDADRALARLYDLDLVEDPGDLDLYLALADRSGDRPVLELAVGSGRLAVPLVEAGHRVTGVDLDRAMLERARIRAEASGPSTAAGLELVEGDLVAVDLPAGPTFGLAFIALNSLFLLSTREAQRAAIATMARHLAPGGIAVVDAWVPDADDLARFDGRLVLEYERLDPETGLEVTKVAAARYDPAWAIVDLTSVYEEGQPGQPPRRWVRRDRLRLVTPDELTEFAEAAGLGVETVAGDYDLGPLGPGADRAILVAIKG